MAKFMKLMMAAVLALGLTTFAAQAQEAGYVASKGGEKFHTTDCSTAKKITADKLVKFATPDEAVKAGYSPCKVCNPPPSVDALVATKGGEKYHKQGCRILAKVDTANKVYYKDAAAAEKDGYKPCAICFTAKK